MGKHLQAHIELAGSVRQCEVVNRDFIPRVLLQGAEVDHLRSRQDCAVRIGHKSSEAILRIGDVGLVVVVFHRTHGQVLIGLVTHTRTNDVVIVTQQLDIGGGVGDDGTLHRGHHTPMLAVVVVVLVVGAAHLHVLDLRHIIEMVGEGDDSLGVGGQRSDRDRVMPLLGSTDDVEIDLDVGLGLRTVVTDEGAHHIAHRVLRGGFTRAIDLRDGDIIRIEATHTDTVDVDVVTAPGGSVEGDIDTSVIHIVGEIVNEAGPLRGGRTLQITVQRSGGLALRYQIRIGEAVVGGDLHGHRILLAGHGIVLCEPDFQDGVGGVVQNRDRQDGAGSGVGSKRLGVEEQTADTVHRHDGRVRTFAVLEGPVTGTGNLLNRPSLRGAVAEILLVVGDDVLQREVLAQRIVGVLGIAGIVDDDGEIDRLVARDHHTGGQHFVHAVEGGDGTGVHRDRLVEIQRG